MRTKRISRFAACVLALLMCLPWTGGCAKGTGTPTCQACAEAVFLSQSDMPAMTRISSEDEGFSDWLSTSYDIDPATVVDGAVYYVDGTVADEIAVLRCASSSDARQDARALKDYVEERRGVFSGYAPDAEHMLAESLVLTHDDYVALMVCPSPSAAELAFEHSFDTPVSASDETAETAASVSAVSSASPSAQPTLNFTDAQGEETSITMDSYDHDAVLAAWESGDPSSLSAQNRAVYNAAVQILQDVTNDSMHPYQKERAVHDRLVQMIEYDPLALARDSAEAAPPESSTPYGALVLGQAVCYGYSSSFQLLMDMLGIECLTIDGTINDDNDPHSWNMVNLDGYWYLVDVGWDDPLNTGPTYTFFNRSEDDFLDYNRKWDRDAYPQATGGPLAGEYAM